MKREILFRGIDKLSNTMVFGSLIVRKSKDGSIDYLIENCDQMDFRQWEVHPVTVGQFTGLLDKNGNKIFEGDERKDKYERIEKVFFSKFQGAFCIDYSDLQDEDEYYAELVSHDIENFEIIGNIHANQDK